MKKVQFIILLLSVSILSANAQRISRVFSGVDIGTGYSNGQWAPSMLYYQALHPARAPWVEVSGGARVWSYFANDIDLTAPAGASRSDVMQLSRVSATGVNFVLGANLKIGNSITVGFNADMLGIAFGKRRNALYRLAAPLAAPDSIRRLDGREFGIAPANLNIVPFFRKHNNGQAEAFVRVWVNERFGVKAGYVWGQVAYRADMMLNNEQRRFSSTYGMPFVALSFPMYN